MQEHMLTLQSLPTEDDILKLQEARRLETERRIQQERRHQMALVQQRKKNEESPKHELKQQDVVVKSSGWHPSENVSRTAMDGADPMVQQIGIIRGYIKQARQASKWDEVRMLEENLGHLQQEYWRQTQGPDR